MLRTLTLTLAALLAGGQAFAAQKIITFNASLDAPARQKLVESRGGRIIKDFGFIGAALADFQDATRAADITRAPGVTAAEDDAEIYWLAGENAPMTLDEAALMAGSMLAGEAGPAVPPTVPPAVSTQAPVAPVYVTTMSVEGKADHMPWSLARMHAPQAWAFAKGKGARVAVLDSGVDCTHPDLAAACAPGYNAQNQALPPVDEKGHGTHVSGIIAGALNWTGMVGMAPEATIIPVKVLNSSGTGKVSEVIDGIGWAMRNNADIINMSLGAHTYSQAQEKAVKAARAAGIFVVCAAGNDAGVVSYPAAYEGATAVSALDFASKLASFSCHGPEIDFTAPGVKIFSAAPGVKYQLMSGTSQAAPHISGLAALAVGLGVKGGDAIEAALRQASFNLGLPAEQQGYGVPVADRLVAIITAPKP
jgi:subtilisin